MTTARAAAVILAKELRLELRTRELLNATVVFGIVVVVLFSFAFDPTVAESRRYGPGLLWIAFLFAGSLMLHPSFAREQSNDTLDALRLAPISSFAILLGKMLANFIFLFGGGNNPRSRFQRSLQHFARRNRGPADSGACPGDAGDRRHRNRSFQQLWRIRGCAS